MIDGLGDSWQAVVVTLELDRLMSAGAGGTGYAVVLCVAAAVVIAGYASVRAWRRRPGWEIPHLRNEMEEEWRNLRSRTRTPTQDTIVMTPLHTIKTSAYLACPDLLITYGDSIPGNDSQVSCSPVLPVMQEVAEPVLQDRRDTQDTRRARTPKKSGTPAADACLSDVAQWAEDYLDRQSGGKIQAQPLHANYAAWCSARGKTPVTQYAFGLTMKELGWAKERVGGRVLYLNIALKVTPALRVVREPSPNISATPRA